MNDVTTHSLMYFGGSLALFLPREAFQGWRVGGALALIASAFDFANLSFIMRQSSTWHLDFTLYYREAFSVPDRKMMVLGIRKHYTN